MTGRRVAARWIAFIVILGVVCARQPILAVQAQPPASVARPGQGDPTDAPSLDAGRSARIDGILADPALARAVVSVRIDSLADHRTLYARNAGTLVIPASVMKLVTAAVAADRLGWDYRFTTRLESIGTVQDGVLTGDLILTSDGDPSIGTQDLRPAVLFYEWAEALRSVGIRRVQGRVIVDDNAFDDELLGAGWAWDYLSAGYAAPSSATSYNENVVVLRIGPGLSVGTPATIDAGPPGHRLDIVNEIVTTAAGQPASITLSRAPGTSRVVVRGTIPAGATSLVRTTSVINPTQFLADGLLTGLSDAGVPVSGGAWDIDAVATAPPAAGRRVIVEQRSPPLSSLVGYALKVSQNFYGDMLLKAIGRSGGTGSATAGQRAVRETLSAWKLPADSLVMLDGSGLSRYNYVSADLLVGLLSHAWGDEKLRGPFVAALPVGGHDGTLETRMRGGILDRHVQAKTGTISNVRSLAGYATTNRGEKLAFSIIVNNFTAANAEIDRVVERVLEKWSDRDEQSAAASSDDGIAE